MVSKSQEFPCWHIGFRFVLHTWPLVFKGFPLNISSNTSSTNNFSEIINYLYYFRLR